MGRKIKKNVIRCKHCGDVIESKSVHDFRYCRCQTVFVDGGLEYLRRGFANSPDDYEELSEYEDEEEDSNPPYLIWDLSMETDYDFEEVCPECDSVIPIILLDKNTYSIECPVCGHHMMLCSYCESDSCDWEYGRGCFRERR